MNSMHTASTNTIEGYRLSAPQRQIWLRLPPGVCQTAQSILRFDGPLDSARLQAALEQVVARHGILRTAFVRQPGRKTPLQVVTEKAVLHWRYAEHAESEFARLAAAERETEFELESGAVVRALLVRVTEARHRLVLTLPALCADHPSLQNLLPELMSAFHGDPDPAGDDPPVQYLQVSEWQHALLEDQEDPGHDFWRRQKPASLAPLSLPLQGSGSEFTPVAHEHDLSPAVSESLYGISHALQTPLPNLLLGAWKVLLGRFAGREDVAVCVATSGRGCDELSGVIGPLTQYLPLAGEIAASQPFLEMARVTAAAWEAVSEQQETFPAESFFAGPARRSPWIVFEHIDQPPAVKHRGLTARIESSEAFAGPFAMKLTSIGSDDGLKFRLHYDATRFDRIDAERLLAGYQALLDSMATAPQQPVGGLDVVDPAMRRMLLERFAVAKDAAPPIGLVHQHIEAQAALDPDKTAVVCEDQRLSYGQLNQQANRIAHLLQERGVGPETVVGIYALRSPHFVAAMLGIMKAGGAYLPLDPALPAAGVEFRLRDAGALLLLTEEILAQHLPQLALPVLRLDADRELFEQLPDHNPESEIQGENLAYLMFTSGSTGRPKAVAVEHRNLASYVAGISERLAACSPSSFAMVSTFAADLGNTAIFPALCTGAALHVIAEDRAADAVAMADYFARHAIDCMKIVPSHLAVLLESAEPSSILPRKWLILGGEAASWQLAARLEPGGCRILNHYGPTETTVGVLTYEIDAKQRQGQSVPIGRPLPGNSAYVLDESLRPVPIGAPGELYIGGRQLARGYFGHGDSSAARFVEHPFDSAAGARLYRTGDRVRYLNDGNLEFLGRVDQQVKLRGFRIELGEIEAVLAQHPAVRQAVVTLWCEKEHDQRLVAYIVARRRETLRLSELRDLMREKLATYMRPSVFIPLKSVPLTRNGKVDRQKLPPPNFSRPELAGDFVGPRTETERRIAQMWSDVLGVEKVGVHDSFFDLGGHSLLAVQVHSKLRGAFQRELPITDLIRYRTVEALASYFDQPQPTSSTAERSKERADARLAARSRRRESRPAARHQGDGGS